MCYYIVSKFETEIIMRKKKRFDIGDYASCFYCTKSRELTEGELLLCRDKGLVPFDGKCRHFELDLLSVTPKKLRSLRTELTEEDFKL